MGRPAGRPAAPYTTDSVREGLMDSRPWNDAARDLRRSGFGTPAIADRLGLTPSIVQRFFSPDAYRRELERKRAEHTTGMRDAAYAEYVRWAGRRNRERRSARAPSPTRQTDGETR